MTIRRGDDPPRQRVTLGEEFDGFLQGRLGTVNAALTQGCG